MGKIRALTCGIFDYNIHKGHLKFLSRCNLMCDELYIAVVPDHICCKIKRKPYFPYHIRCQNLIDTGLIDGVIYFRNSLYSDIIKFKPDLYILGKDQSANVWSIVLIKLLYELNISTISTFEQRIESTTQLLTIIGYI